MLLLNQNKNPYIRQAMELEEDLRMFGYDEGRVSEEIMKFYGKQILKVELPFMIKDEYIRDL